MLNRQYHVPGLPPTFLLHYHLLKKNLFVYKNSNFILLVYSLSHAKANVLSDNLKCIYHHHHRAANTDFPDPLSLHFSLSFIASGRSSGLHPLSLHSCCMYVRASRPAFARPYVGVHRSTSLMSSSLLLQQCPACLVRLTWIVFLMGGRWPYSWCLVGCCR